MFCPKCGKQISGESNFCKECGAPLQLLPPTTQDPKNYSVPTALIVSIMSVVSAIYILYFRIVNQEFLGYDVTHGGTGIDKFYGIDPDVKPLISFIPLTVMVVAALMVAFDKTLSKKKRISVLIVSAVFAIISLLLIWINIPGQYM